MATVFSDGDRRRIVTALKLERSQLRSQSRLDALMRNTEIEEAQGATGLVDDIRAILSAIEDAADLLRGDTGEALQPVIQPAGSMPDDLDVIDIPNEIRMERAIGRSSTENPVATKAANLQRLRTLLDPDDLLRGVSSGGNILF
jgi:hypothetical protein